MLRIYYVESSDFLSTSITQEYSPVDTWVKSCLLRPSLAVAGEGERCLGPQPWRGWSVSTALPISSRTCRRPLFPVILGMVFQIVARQGASFMLWWSALSSFLGAFWTGLQGKTRGECYDPLSSLPQADALLLGAHSLWHPSCEMWQVWNLGMAGVWR